MAWDNGLVARQFTPDKGPENAGHKVVFHLKIAVSRGFNGDWAMYLAPGHWSDSDAVGMGDKMSEPNAKALLQQLQMFSVTELRYDRSLNYRR